jgi:CelD/BcsL family acetyltransferase involved in cellulose biosynthesis
LVIDGHIAAVDYTLRSRDRVFTYNGAFDDQFASLAPGILSMTYLLERAFDSGVVEVDLLRGDESYKFQWATGLRQQSNLRLTRAGTAVAHAYLLRGWQGLRRRTRRLSDEAIERPVDVVGAP